MKFVTKPLYEQVRDTLAENIADGTWRATHSIPNEIELARNYGVSVGTMRKALGTLEEEGLLTRRQGRGTFVADHASSELRAKFDKLCKDDGQPLGSDIRQLARDVRAANFEEQTRLSLAATDIVVTYRQIVRVDQKPAIYREAHVAQHRHPTFGETDTWELLAGARRFSLWLGSGSETIRFRKAEASATEALGLRAGTNLISLDRVVYTLDGRPLEWLQSWTEFTNMRYEVALI